MAAVFPLQGYAVVRTLRTSGQTRVFEVRREHEAETLLARVQTIVDPAVCARVEYELRLLQKRPVQGIGRVLEVAWVDEQLIVIHERLPGITLHEHSRGQPLPLGEFLSLALGLTALLERIHENRIIHRDLRPSTILIDPEMLEVRLVDQGLAALLDSSRQRLHEPDYLRLVLPYISPEQTGRTRREIDLRTDLYSLGVIFYELLTGRCPFVGGAVLELVHAHLARRPRPPRELRRDLPALLGAMVMKLLEKAPEHRYQSARGLHADLARIVDSIAEGNAEPEFPLAEHDLAPILQLGHRRYGREAELARLEQAFIEAREQSDLRLVLVEGAAGLGKSELLRALEVRLAERGAYLGSGHFVERGEQPTRGLGEAINMLLEQLLGESEARLGEWREHLLARLGPLVTVIGELAPTLAWLLGPLPELPRLSPDEARQRLHVAVRRLLAALAERGPVALLLDDLQWAEPSSVELLRSLAAGIGGPLLIVAALRSDESERSGTLTRLRIELSESLRAPIELRLAPLDSAALEQMLAELLGRAAGEVRELAELIAHRSEGNPLFVQQFLRHLVEQELVRASPSGWRWDIDAITKTSLPTDVVGIVEGRLGRFSSDELRLLEQAACVGFSFDLATLAWMQAHEQSSAHQPLGAEQRAAALQRFEAEGLIVSVSRGWQFSHERVHAQVRARLSAEERARLHWRLAEVLAARRRAEQGSPEIEGEGLAALLEHLVEGLPAIEDVDKTERIYLAGLSWLAGGRAMRAAAWATAERDLAVGVALLAPLRSELLPASGRESDVNFGDNPPGDARALAFALHFAHAQALALSGRSDEAADAFARLLDWDLTLHEYAQVVARRIRLLAMQEHIREAIDLGLTGLARCGFRVGSSVAALLVNLARTRLDLHALIDVPLASDQPCTPEVSAAMYILDALHGACFVTDKRLYVTLTCLHARLVLRGGSHPTAPVALAQLGIVVIAVLRNPSAAARLCDRALDQLEQVPEFHRPRIESCARLFVWPHSRPFTQLVPGLDELFERALEVGDRETAGYVAGLGLRMMVETDVSLREVVALGVRLRAELQPWATAEQRTITSSVLGSAIALGSRERDEPVELIGRAEAERAGASAVAVYGIATTTALTMWLLGRREDAARELEPNVENYRQVSLGSWNLPRFVLLRSLCLADQYERSGGREPSRRALLDWLRRARSDLARAAASAPANFSAAVTLIEAERLRVQGRSDAAIERYELARSRAESNGLTYVAGIAAERLLELAHSLGQTAAAEGALRLARHTYRRWGAWAVLARLDADQPATVLAPARRENSTQTTSSDAGLFDYDIDGASMLETIQAISEELHLDQVIVRVLGAAIDHAGADRGVLLLEREGTIGIVAEGSTGSVTPYLDSPIALTDADERLPRSVVEAVLRTGKPVILDEFDHDPALARDPYLTEGQVASLLCMPIVKHSRRVGALLLEHETSPEQFTFERLEVLRSLAGQAASALDNARLYAALQRSEAQWRSLVGGVPDIIALIDDRGRIEFVNHLDPYEIDVAQVRGLAADAFMQADSALEWREAFREVVTRGVMRELEVQIAAPGEGARWYMTRLAPISVGGRVTKVISISTDIDERRRSEENRVRLEAQLRQQQRLESLGTLASGVAHEINNPIQGIMNYAELIAERANEQDMVEEFADEISHESQRVASIVRNLLAFSREERDQQLVQTSVRSLIDSTLSLLRTVLRKDQIQLELDVPDGLPPLRCRVQQIQQIIMNLVTNARDALNERWGGFAEDKRIILRARTEQRDGRPWIRLSIEDRGGGVPEGVLARIFDPFFTTKGRDKGTGLGLAVSHGIAAEHGGELTVDNEPGVGATFHLDLPAFGANEPVAAEHEQPQ